MITGAVNLYEARIKLRIVGPRGVRQIQAVVDTGFTGSLTLPLRLITSLGLPWHSFDRSTLADGSECLFDVFVATVVWDGYSQRILVDEADADPPIGMRLMNGYELRMQIRRKGRMTLKRLTR
jgi:clan AA aspartic protease